MAPQRDQRLKGLGRKPKKAKGKQQQASREEQEEGDRVERRRMAHKSP
jgi:hypothetical protein